MPRELPPTGGVPPTKKRAAFIKVAGPRVSNLLYNIEMLAICADRNRYEVYDTDGEKVREKVEPAIADLLDRFRTGRRKSFVEFDEHAPKAP